MTGKNQLAFIKKECISHGCWDDKIEKAFQLVEKDLDSIERPTKKEQMEWIKEQIRFLNNQEVELSSRRHTLEELLEKMQDEEALERAKGGKK